MTIFEAKPISAYDGFVKASAFDNLIGFANLSGETMDNREIELKLHLTPASLAAWKRHPTLKRLKQGRASTKLLFSHYYDTPSLSLAKAGFSLRLRKVGKATIQTLKSMGTRTGGLFSRGEWEMPVEGDTPDLALFRAAGLDDKVFDKTSLAAELAPIFSTEVKRTACLLQDGDTLVELCFDEGAIILADQSRRQDLCEVELEVKQGRPEALFAMALEFQSGHQAQVLTTSKSDRGFALLKNTRPRAVKAQSILLEPKQNVAESFQAIARSCLGHLLANQDCVSQYRDEEGVHQMRVALRRLRSAINVFSSLVGTPALEDLKDEMRWLMSQLGPVRDTDVFIGEILDPVAKRHAQDSGIDELVALYHTNKALYYDQALDALASPRFATLILRLAAWIEDGEWLTGPGFAERAELAEGIKDFAIADLARRHRKVLKAGRQLADLPPAERHAERIRIKRLRYSGEFFQSLFGGKKTRKYLTGLATLQDLLGKMNDIHVAHTLLSGAVDATAQPRLGWAAGLVAGWHDSRYDPLLAELLDEWQKFETLAKFWDSKN